MPKVTRRQPSSSSSSQAAVSSSYNNFETRGAALNSTKASMNIYNLSEQLDNKVGSPLRKGAATESSSPLGGGVHSSAKQFVYVQREKGATRWQ
jgi:hypothetical protein